MEIDRTSNLPENFIEQTLSNFSFNGGVRTSLLSADWRYKWNVTLFHGEYLYFPEFNNDEASIAALLESIINHSIVHHSGPVNKFELSCGTQLPFSVIDMWIRCLLKKSIKELVIEIPPNSHYNVHSSLFLCQDLTRLKLSYCSVKLFPRNFEGLKNLKSLHLEFVRISVDLFEKLIGSCPVLETLTLRSLDFGGLCSLNLLNCLSHLPNLHSLEVNLIESLFGEVVPRDQIVLSGHLRKLCFTLDFHSPENIFKALYLLRSVPNLEDLKVESITEAKYNVEIPVDIEEINTRFKGNCSLAQLQHVEIAVIGLQNEIAFMKYMRSVSPGFEMRIVNLDRNGIS